MDWTRIKQMRKAAGVTQEQLANKLGVNRATISKYESGQIEPTISMLENIASALGIHILDFVGIGKELDRYTYEIKNISFPSDMLSEEREKNRRMFSKLDSRALYDSLSDKEKEEFWEIGRNYQTEHAEEISKIVQDYMSLDQWGKQTVRAVISAEQQRIQQSTSEHS